MSEDRLDIELYLVIPKSISSVGEKIFKINKPSWKSTSCAIHYSLTSLRIKWGWIVETWKGVWKYHDKILCHPTFLCWYNQWNKTLFRVWNKNIEKVFYSSNKIHFLVDQIKTTTTLKKLNLKDLIFSLAQA